MITIVVYYVDGNWDFVKIDKEDLPKWQKTWLYNGKEVLRIDLYE